MVLAAAGKVDEDALLKMAEARFGDLSPGSRAVAEQARYGGGRLADDRTFEQAHLTMAFEGVGYTEAGQSALALYSSEARRVGNACVSTWWSWWSPWY